MIQFKNKKKTNKILIKKRGWETFKRFPPKSMTSADPRHAHIEKEVLVFTWIVMVKTLFLFICIIK